MVAIVAQNKTHCSLFPPHEQLLVAVVKGVAVVGISWVYGLALT